jgi:hypothetical protein
MARSTAEEIKDLAEFRRRRAERRGVFVIVGRPSGRVLIHDVTCPFMTDDAFEAKMVLRRGRKGRYLWASDPASAMDEFGAVRCRHPADPV